MTMQWQECFAFFSFLFFSFSLLILSMVLLMVKIMADSIGLHDNTSLYRWGQKNIACIDWWSHHVCKLMQLIHGFVYTHKPNLIFFLLFFLGTKKTSFIYFVYLSHFNSHRSLISLYTPTKVTIHKLCLCTTYF